MKITSIVRICLIMFLIVIFSFHSYGQSIKRFDFEAWVLNEFDLTTTIGWSSDNHISKQNWDGVRRLYIGGIQELLYNENFESKDNEKLYVRVFLLNNNGCTDSIDEELDKISSQSPVAVYTFYYKKGWLVLIEKDSKNFININYRFTQEKRIQISMTGDTQSNNIIKKTVYLIDSNANIEYICLCAENYLDSTYTYKDEYVYWYDSVGRLTTAISVALKDTVKYSYVDRMIQLTGSKVFRHNYPIFIKNVIEALEQSYPLFETTMFKTKERNDRTDTLAIHYTAYHQDRRPIIEYTSLLRRYTMWGEEHVNKIFDNHLILYNDSQVITMPMYGGEFNKEYWGSNRQIDATEIIGPYKITIKTFTNLQRKNHTIRKQLLLTYMNRNPRSDDKIKFEQEQNNIFNQKNLDVLFEEKNRTSYWEIIRESNEKIVIDCKRKKILTLNN